MLRISALAWKEVRQLARDPLSVAVHLVLPAVMLVLFGTVLSLDVRHVRLAILDRDATATSRRLVSALTASDCFDRAATLEADAEVEPSLRRGDATMIVAIPRGTERGLLGDGAAVQLVVDGSNATVAQTAQGYAERALSRTATRLVPAGPAPDLEPRTRVLFNPDLASFRFLLPGLMAMLLMVEATVATALTVARERETGTMEQLLVSPLSPAEVVLGKALPYFGLSMLAAVLVMGTASGAFGLSVRGSPLLLLLLAVLFVVGAQGLGFLISSITRSQQVAFQIATYATMLPSFILSGFVFPIRSMPLPLRVLSYVVPARYLIDGVRGVVLKGAGLDVLWRDVAGLAVFAMVTLGGATWRLRRSRL